MNTFEEIQIPGFIIAGISIKTKNKDGQSMKDMGELFNKFFSEQIANTIPNKESDEVYCMYTDYESDFRGEYLAIIGCKVKEIDNISEELTVKYIPSSKYRKYTSKGEIHQCVGETWNNIWESPDSYRKYEADFDVYGNDAQNPEDATVYTYVSVK